MLSQLPTALAAAEPAPSAPEEATTFRLGGAVAALVPEIELSNEPETRGQLSLPSVSPQNLSPQHEVDFGPATVFMGERLGVGPDALQMGTFLRQGAARAGVSITYLEEAEEIAQSEVFLGYDLTENFSVGLSSVLNSELDADETVQQFGISAEFMTESGTYVQGGFSDADEYDPVFGLSMGLRF